MNKLTSTILAVILVSLFTLFAVASGSSEDDGNATQAAGQAQSSDKANDTLGSYAVEIKDARLTKTYDGKSAVVITYGFTNNGDSAISFTTAISDNVYQNGIGLNKAYILTDNDPYSEDNQLKDIKTGATLDVEVAYELNDDTTDIEVEVSEWISFNDDTITRTFSIK